MGVFAFYMVLDALSENGYGDRFGRYKDQKDGQMKSMGYQ